MNNVQRVLPWILGVIVSVYVVSLCVRRADTTSAQDWESIGRMPVSADGRVKPLDTFARNNLMAISGRQTFDAGNGRRASAVEWMVELIAKPEKADAREVFRIDHPDLVAMLGLGETKRTRFSFNELTPHLDEIGKQAQLASQVPNKKRDPYQRAVVDLGNKLMIYSEISRLETPYMVAPMKAGEDWRPLSEALRDPKAASHESVAGVVAILQGAAADNTPEMNTQAQAYLSLVSTRLGGETTKAGYEVVFNRLEPFYQASVLYLLAFVLACAGFLMGPLSRPEWSASLARSALIVMAITFVVHTLGIASRIYLQGRPPVTNLYSSAVFIGWACIPVAIFAERFARLGLGTVTAALIGFGTLVVAHNLSSGGDTMEMMQAVLDSNFWLATHVVVVTIGYSATFLAGFLGAAYILLGALTPFLRGEGMKAIPKMTYGVICFASITSFVGTVLGGIWADQSWGRFWGWDPKENGAALIVLMNLLILHARWGGMIKERGVAVLAVAGNIVTAWSWFGTNMLGVGLHSYGFMESAVFWLVGFAASQLLIMAIGGFVKPSAWRSLRPAPEKSGPTPKAPRARPSPAH